MNQENQMLDERVLDAVKTGCKRAAQVMLRVRDEMRPVDRSLQRLRKKGAIEYTTNGWRVTARSADPE